VNIQNLRNLSLRNFRSHKNLELDLNSNFVFFSGPNGVGKTNILEAISLFSPGRGLRGANLNDLKSISSSVNWKLFSVFQVAEELLEVEICLDDDGKKTIRVDGKKKPLIYLGNILKIIWLTPSMDRLWTGVASERRKFLDRIVMNFFPDHPRDCLFYEQALRKRNQLFKENQTDLAWFSAIEKQMAEIGYRIDVNRRKVINILIESQKTLIERGFLPYLEVYLSSPEIINIEKFQEDLFNGRTKDKVLCRTLIGPHRSDLVVRHRAKNIEARYCSTGEQKALLLTLFVANAFAICRKFGAPPIILLDEIVAHLDQENFLNFFDQLKFINAQIFATGTEKSYFERLNLDFLSFDLKLTEEGIGFLVN